MCPLNKKVRITYVIVGSFLGSFATTVWQISVPPDAPSYNRINTIFGRYVLSIARSIVMTTPLNNPLYTRNEGVTMYCLDCARDNDRLRVSKFYFASNKRV